MTILCIHGVGRHKPGGKWETAWRKTIGSAIESIDPDAAPEIVFVYLDDIFKSYPITFLGTLEAIGKLAANAITSPFRKSRGIGVKLRWTAGMVVQWVENEKLRRSARELVASAIGGHQPDVICAHSLGSLIAYDAMTTDPSLVAGRTFISFGSQIGNPFVTGQWAGGRLVPLAKALCWYHLYNREDDAFTARIGFSDVDNFLQVETYFDVSGILDHDAELYLSHRETVDQVWSRILTQTETPELYARPKSFRAARWAESPRRRALLIGINNYPKPDDRLEGCVNDVFLMSSVLQESGFEAEDIRVVLDERATARGITDRLHWLLDDGKRDDVRFLYYSGHGTQMPTYGLGDRVDQMDESLVPYDFDWSPERAITDNLFYGLYSQLPYDMHFIAMFDCCHSGGLTKGAAKIRGINPPDDIRHRELRWNVDHQMWVERTFASPNKEMAEHLNRRAMRTTHKLGQAMALRRTSRKTYHELQKKFGHQGPYLPLLIYACQEEELAYEYRHGVQAHGAFTYCLAKNLRGARQKRKKPTFQELVRSVARELRELKYEQHPHLVGPTAKKKSTVPILQSPKSGSR